MILYNNLSIYNINIVSSRLGKISMKEVGIGTRSISSHKFLSNQIVNLFICVAQILILRRLVINYLILLYI